MQSYSVTVLQYSAPTPFRAATIAFSVTTITIALWFYKHDIKAIRILLLVTTTHLTIHCLAETKKCFTMEMSLCPTK